MKNKKNIVFVLLLCLAVVCLIGSFLLGIPGPGAESVKEAMRDAVLHETGQISFFGLKDVNPGLFSAMTVTVILLVFAAILRIFVIPKFTMVPGKLQLLLEEWVGYFSGMAKKNSPHLNDFLGAYLFAAGSYIFVSTIFELFGLQGVTVGGSSIALPAPLSDINGAIALGCLSYVIILSGGIRGNGLRGVGSTLKDFSLPISMSFRLFGAMLSGLLVTELVYFYFALSFVIPIFVAVMFTILHALIQTYVLTTLTSIFYGEVSEPSKKRKEKQKAKQQKKELMMNKEQAAV